MDGSYEARRPCVSTQKRAASSDIISRHRSIRQPPKQSSNSSKIKSLKSKQPFKARKCTLQEKRDVISNPSSDCFASKRPASLSLFSLIIFEINLRALSLFVTAPPIERPPKREIYFFVFQKCSLVRLTVEKSGTMWVKVESALMFRAYMPMLLM